MSDQAATRWAPEHVLAMAPDVAAAGAARSMAVPSRWAGTGSDDEAAWGLCRGSGAEPYQVVAELVEPAFRCTCPSRKLPCKHVLGLLLLWANGHVPGGARPAFAGEWLARRAARTVPPGRVADQVGGANEVELDLVESGGRRAAASGERGAGGDRERRGEPGPDRRALERAARVSAGLAELDRWIADRVRVGLGDAALASYATWDQVAARLVDAQAPALANRVRRLGGAVGARPDWHDHVLAELGTMHLLAVAGRRLPALATDAPALADSVRTVVGWQLRQADVLDHPPVTDRWHVCGRSDVLEDRVVVRRTWLRGLQTRRWALLLTFAAYGQSLGGEPVPGTVLRADLHPYPGAVPLRVLIGVVHEPAVVAGGPPPASSIVEACADVGLALAAEPWLERYPITVEAAPATSSGRWVLTDSTGSLPLALETAGGHIAGLATLVAVSGGGPVAVTAEWTAAGVVPLAVHDRGETVDIGPRGGWR